MQNESLKAALSCVVLLFFGGLTEALAATSAQSSKAQSSKLPRLTHVDQVRRLSPSEAERGYPVRIRGVITADGPAPDFFVQDSTAGIYVEGSHSPVFSHRLGDRVEIEGISGPGRFAPVVRERSVRVLGPGKLPRARLSSWSELANGQKDSQWIQVRGTVLSASIDRTSWKETTLVMSVASGGGRFKTRVPVTSEVDASAWVDRQVVIEGVCGTLFNFNRQLVGVLLYVPRLRFIQEAQPAREVSFGELMRFSPDQGTFRRVRVRGVVAHQQRGSAIFLESEGQGLRILSQQDTPLHPGDIVEASGFPAVGESTPILEDAVFKKMGRMDPPRSTNLVLSGPWERFDGVLVSLNAKLLPGERLSEGPDFLLQSGDRLFTATAQNDAVLRRMAAIASNSELRLSGICLVHSGGLWGIPQSFRLLVREPGDIVILRAPSWWTLRHALWLLGICVGVLFCVTILLVIVGGRLRAQMAVIREKIRMDGIHEERNRIARELHDTLEQDLAGITMQLDLAFDCFQQTPQVAQQALAMARKMSRRSMIEARRSVWDMRCQLLENGDLVSALTQTVTSFNTDRTKIDVRVEGEPRRLTTTIEMNLLRIGQEAVINAVRHAQSSLVTVLLQFRAQCVRLCVADDGRGFEPNEAALNGSSHFGLLDMRERAQSLGSSLQIDSKPGAGTHVTVEVREAPGQ
jgi:signal transduction histidine kinase